MNRAWSWIVLIGLLVVTVLGAATLDRREWPSLVGDEATYAVQAESLAYDLDLAYSRNDYDRFVYHWGHLPENLILQSTDDGEHITFGKPFLYALAVSPFVRVSPLHGAMVANALLLALAALVAARSLERQLGAAAPLWVAVFVFASVSFAYVFWIHSDLFLLCTTAVAFALAYRDVPPARSELPQVYDAPPDAPSLGFALRWAVVGMLLGIPAAYRPFLLILLLPAALAVPRRRRRVGILSLAGGAAALLVVTFAVHQMAGGAWMGYGSERQGFYSYTGYPEVDFPASEWPQSVRRWGNTSWIHEESLKFRIEPRLWGWNVVYFLVGRDIGVLPYFLPLVLVFGVARWDRGRWALLLAVLLAGVCFLLIRPFNFWGGAGAIANRYFLPLYPAIWFVAGRPAKARWALAAALCALPFMWPLWREPRHHPLQEDGTYRHVSTVAQRWLPYETTQSHLKPAGQEDVVHNGLWLKFLNPSLSAVGEGEELEWSGSSEAELIIGYPRSLAQLRLELDARGPAQIEVKGGSLGNTVYHPDGSVSFWIDLKRPRARHAMWWSWEPYCLYHLRLRLPVPPLQPISVRLRGLESVNPSEGA